MALGQGVRGELAVTPWPCLTFPNTSKSPAPPIHAPRFSSRALEAGRSQSLRIHRLNQQSSQRKNAKNCNKFGGHFCNCAASNFVLFAVGQALEMRDQVALVIDDLDGIGADFEVFRQLAGLGPERAGAVQMVRMQPDAGRSAARRDCRRQQSACRWCRSRCAAGQSRSSGWRTIRRDSTKRF